MCERQEYLLLIDNNLNGHKLSFPEFPDLDIIYIKNENNLCLSYYSEARCIQAGNLSVTLKINNHLITLRSNMENEVMINNYEFKGLMPIVKNKSKKETYIIISIEKCDKKHIYNSVEISQESQQITKLLGQPFILEFHDNSSTGYSWKLQVTSGIKIVRDSHSNRCQEGITGCGGIRTFILEGIKKGSQEVIAIHGRQWDPTTNTKYKYVYDII